MVERCRFLLHEIRPYYTVKCGLRKVKVLFAEPKLKTACKKVVQQMVRKLKGSTSAPEGETHQNPRWWDPAESPVVSRTLRVLQDQTIHREEALAEQSVSFKAQVLQLQEASRQLLQRQQRELSDETEPSDLVYAGEARMIRKNDENEDVDVDDEAKDEDSKKHESDGSSDSSSLVSVAQKQLSEDDDQDDDSSNLNHNEATERDRKGADIVEEAVIAPMSVAEEIVNDSNGLGNARLDSGFKSFKSAVPVLDAKLSALIVGEILDFVLAETTPPITVLRKALFRQMKRAQLRLQGMQELMQLLRLSDLMPSVKYYLVSSWQGHVSCSARSDISHPLPQCLEDVAVVPPYTKAQVIKIINMLNISIILSPEYMTQF